MTLVGIDIGGTQTRVGLVSRRGVLLASHRIATRPEYGSANLMKLVTESINSLINTESGSTNTPDRVSIGLGITGPVDVRTGIVTNPYTLTGWSQTDVLQPIRQAFPTATIAIENDANAAAIGEWWTGSGQGVDRFAMVTVGTGIGVGMMVKGAVWRRSDGRHCEAGHQVLDPNGPVCYCGARGCWEALASGTSLKHRLGNIDDLDHPIARDAIAEMGYWIGLGLVNICATFGPDRIAIGGGVSSLLSSLLPSIEQTLRNHRVMIPTDVPVGGAHHGDNAGMIGAAYAAYGLASDAA
jgi:glucokinase